MTSLWIWLLLPLRDFVSENCHVKFGGNWTTNKGEMYNKITTNYPSLNRVKVSQLLEKIEKVLLALFLVSYKLSYDMILDDDNTHCSACRILKTERALNGWQARKCLISMFLMQNKQPNTPSFSYKCIAWYKEHYDTAKSAWVFIYKARCRWLLEISQSTPLPIAVFSGIRLCKPISVVICWLTVYQTLF